MTATAVTVLVIEPIRYCTSSGSTPVAKVPRALDHTSSPSRTTAVTSEGTRPLACRTAALRSRRRVVRGSSGVLVIAVTLVTGGWGSSAKSGTMEGMSTQPHMAARMENRLGLEYPRSLDTFDSYADAQKAVDYLADNEFPVEDVMIVGTDLKQVERVSGRLTTRKVLLGGLLSGIWIGVFVGLIFAMFDGGEGLVQRLVSTVLIGAAFGVIWAWLGYRSTGGQRDFTSVSQVVASRYEVLTEHRHAQRARELLDELDPMRAAQEKLRRNQEQARAEQERLDRERGGPQGGYRAP